MHLPFGRVVAGKGDWRQNFRISCHDPLVIPKLSSLLVRHFQELLTNGRTLLILCIGTDRSTGDALGPLTGTRLQELNLPGTVVRGTLEKPVHAANLSAAIRGLREASTPVLASTPAWGEWKCGHHLCFPGSLAPGRRQQGLPPLENCTSRVRSQCGGFMEYFVLQNTRLALVHKMAMTIASALHWALWQVHSEREGMAGQNKQVAALSNSRKGRQGSAE